MAKNINASISARFIYGLIFPINRFFVYMAEGNRWLISIYELMIWYAIFYSFVGTRTFHYFYYGLFTVDSIIDPIDPYFKALTLWFIPLVFTYIFGVSPIFSIFLKIVSKSDEKIEPKIGVVGKVDKNEEVEVFLKELISSSDRLAKDIHRRGGVYIFTGIVFSALGMYFFYTQTHDLIRPVGVTDQLITLAPKFGILIFIELISFFFLKQYRISMEEFRYFEAIKRSREETLAIVKLVSNGGEKVNYMELLDKLRFSSNVGRLESGQTTELLEAKKFDKDELDFFVKLADVVAKKGS